MFLTTKMRVCMSQKVKIMGDGYYCVICGKYIEAVDGVIVHDDIPHPPDMTFDEEDNPQ